MCFDQKESIRVQFFRFLIVLTKLQPIPHAIFETTRSGLNQILHRVQCHEMQILCFFVAHTFYSLDIQ